MSQCKGCFEASASCEVQLMYSFFSHVNWFVMEDWQRPEVMILLTQLAASLAVVASLWADFGKDLIFPKSKMTN